MVHACIVHVKQYIQATVKSELSDAGEAVSYKSQLAGVHLIICACKCASTPA